MCCHPGEEKMIHDNDRSYYFGASDTRYIMAKNHNSQSWRYWWNVKLGVERASSFNTIYTEAGTRYEHHIADYVSPDGIVDGQIIIEKLRLRVNYDVWDNGKIIEIKTHQKDKPYEVTKEHWMQTQIEMYAYREMAAKLELPKFRGCEIISYSLEPYEYHLLDEEIIINPAMIQRHPIEYDREWITREFLPILKTLAKGLKKNKEWIP